MAKKYYSLLVRSNTKSPWCVEFGDYDRDVVMDELRDYMYHDNKRMNLKIICTGDTQAEINAEVERLNGGSV